MLILVLGLHVPNRLLSAPESPIVPSSCKNPDRRVISEVAWDVTICGEGPGLAQGEGRGLMYLVMYTTAKAGLGNDRRSRAVKWFRPKRSLTFQG